MTFDGEMIRKYNVLSWTEIHSDLLSEPDKYQRSSLFKGMILMVSISSI